MIGKGTTLMRRLILVLLAAATATGAEAPVPAEEGFVPLFNGKDVTGWVERIKGGYAIEDGVLVCKAGKASNYLFTEKEYSNFVVRFEFRLSPGAYNGFGIRTPLEGIISRTGIEFTILDNTHPKYAKLKPYQYHGSIYGVVPAKRGHLKPVGEWNREEVVANGSKLTCKLNGVVIVETDIAPIIASGKTLDGRGVKGHPGLLRKRGRIALLGHGDRLEFRNLRIKELD